MASPGKRPPAPQGRFLGMPWDWRKPTGERLASRAWNSGDHRVLTPKTFGWGYGLNFYWIAHPLRYLRGRSSSTG